MLKLNSITKLEASIPILQNISFSQHQSQKIAIAGETGSGKSTLLKIIAGLSQPDEGEVIFEEKRVLGPYERLIPGHPHIAYLSQHFELRNNYRVEEVLQYANLITDEEAESLYRICRIDHLLKRKTDQLSGGERQRIALARLLIGSPRLLLLDEPFSNLDTPHKNILKSVIEDIGSRIHISCILVSHEPYDLLTWADEIIILKTGKIVQIGTPHSLYAQPVNEYVASLFGKYNLVDPELFSRASPVAANAKGKLLFARPEELTINEDEKGAQAVVSGVRFAGSYYEIETLLPDNNTITIHHHGKISVGDAVHITIKTGNGWYVPAGEKGTTV